MMEIKLFDKTIRKNSSDNFLILEAGTNHYELGDFLGISHVDAAKKMIDAAATTGADAIKFQTYKADTLLQRTSPDYNYFLRHSTMRYSDYIDLIKYARKKKIHFMTTLFDIEGIEMFGDKLEVFKIASPDITCEILLKRINEFKKPVLLSIGASNIDEVPLALRWLEDCPVVIMYCKAIYPLPANKHNLGAIKTLNEIFPNNVIGFSTHGEASWLIPALHMGANILEIHFKTTDVIKGNDYGISINSEKAIDLKKSLNFFNVLYGSDEYPDCLKEEIPVRKNGRRKFHNINGKYVYLRP